MQIKFLKILHNCDTETTRNPQIISIKLRSKQGKALMSLSQKTIIPKCDSPVHQKAKFTGCAKVAKSEIIECYCVLGSLQAPHMVCIDFRQLHQKHNFFPPFDALF